MIRFVNRQTEALFGHDRQELVGKTLETLVPEPLRHAHSAHRSDYFAHPITRPMGSRHELTGRRRDGTEFPVDVSLSSIDTQDGLFVIASVRDLTDRRNIERALLESNVELEHASRMKSQFLATMSHELRTPLNSVIGFSEALKDGILGDLTERQREYIGEIFDSGEHLLALVNDILDLSKVEAGMMNLQLDEGDVRLLLTGALSVVRETAAARRIGLDLELAEDLGRTGLDLRKTKQIVYNLLSNAVKFSDEDSRVTLRAQRVPRSAVGVLSVGAPGGTWPVRSFALADNEYNEFLEIAVTDAGIGIAEENLGRLFQSFSQIDSSPARRFEGTGLGLAMVKQMTELLGGTVAVASKHGEGTCIAAWIPLRATTRSAADEHQAVSTETTPATGLGKLVALVVQDDDAAADLLRTLLEAENFTVIRVRNAAEAFHLPGQKEHRDKPR
jgi:PAS domain S-box-containing protein